MAMIQTVTITIPETVQVAAAAIPSQKQKR